MTRVLIVHRDPAVAERLAAELREAGYEVERCGGPQRVPCPVLDQLPCSLVDWADVLVYDAWVAGTPDACRQLVVEMRETYPDLPVILTSVDASIDWVETEGPHRVTALPGIPDRATLVAAVETALTEQGMAV
jgi:DNA-binding NtrC family response regulator